MLSLGINTASSNETVVLMKGKKIHAFKTWLANFDESEKLLPTIAELLKKTHHSWEDISKIMVVQGPGPFSALRIGVTTANVLAFALRATLFSVDTETFWRRRVKTKPILLFHAGGKYVARRGAGLPKTLSSVEAALNLPKKYSNTPLLFFGDLTENERREFELYKKESWNFINEKNLESQAHAFINLLSKDLHKVKTATPLYWKPPNISKPRPK